VSTGAETNWEELYQKGDTGWEKGEPSPGLVDFLASPKRPPTGTVLVPGCGSGNDVRAFSRAGYSATGVDLAPSAVRSAKEKTAAAGLKADFRLGNFLRDEPFASFDIVFEHTLFCAINPAERDAYVQAVLRWLKPEGLYIAVFYMIDDVDGPPFGVKREEIRRRFDPYFSLAEDWVPRSFENRTGLEWMTLWRPAAS
jgi:SAM-dependent methyltransferase